MLRREQKLRQDLCSGPFLPKIIGYSVPIILTSVLQLLFNAADLMVVGQFEGNDDLGAVGATGSLISLLVNFFMGLSVGAGVCVAQGIGARDDARVRNAVHTAIPTAIVSGAALTVVGVTLSPWMLRLMDTPEKVLDLAAVYMRIYFAGIIPILLYNFGAAILRSAGDTKSPLLYLSVAGVLNVLLNLFFVAVCHMSVAGVALATSLSQCVACALVLRKLMRREDACKLELKKMKIRRDSLLRIFRIGLPAGIQSSLFSISNVTIQSAINSFGEVALSGSTAAGNIEGFVYVSMNSYSQAATTFVGQNSGAGKHKNVGTVTALSLLCVAVTGLAMGIGGYLAAPELLSLYLAEGGAAITYGVNRMRFVCLPYFLCGLMDVLSGALRGMGASAVPMAVSVLGVCVLRILWINTVFRQYRTLSCLFASYPLSWALTLAALTVCFVIIWKRRVKNVPADPETHTAA